MQQHRNCYHCIQGAQCYTDVCLHTIGSRRKLILGPFQSGFGLGFRMETALAEDLCQGLDEGMLLC